MTIHSFLFRTFIYQQQSGAVEACWAHNPEVRGSKPRSANESPLCQNGISFGKGCKHKWSWFQMHKRGRPRWISLRRKFRYIDWQISFLFCFVSALKIAKQLIDGKARETSKRKRFKNCSSSVISCHSVGRISHSWSNETLLGIFQTGNEESLLKYFRKKITYVYSRMHLVLRCCNSLLCIGHIGDQLRDSYRGTVQWSRDTFWSIPKIH